MKLKLVTIALLLHGPLALLDIPTLMNPGIGEAYNRVNGGFGVQKSWYPYSNPMTSHFASDYGTNGFQSMYNLNSIAPFGGDRYTGYDAMTQRFAPQGVASNTYAATISNINGDLGVSPTLLDPNSILYRNFYDRYYDFYHRNLDVLRSKIQIRKGQVDQTSGFGDNHPYTTKFDWNKNWFSSDNNSKKMVGPNLPELKVEREYSMPADRRLELEDVSAKTLRRLKAKASDLRAALAEIEALQRSKTNKLRVEV